MVYKIFAWNSILQKKKIRFQEIWNMRVIRGGSLSMEPRCRHSRPAPPSEAAPTPLHLNLSLTSAARLLSGRVKSACLSAGRLQSGLINTQGWRVATGQGSGHRPAPAPAPAPARTPTSILLLAVLCLSVCLCVYLLIYLSSFFWPI